MGTKVASINTQTQTMNKVKTETATIGTSPAQITMDMNKPEMKKPMDSVSMPSEEKVVKPITIEKPKLDFIDLLKKIPPSKDTSEGIKRCFNAGKAFTTWYP